MIKQIVVLAGGLAKRLHPITEITPKSMVSVAGKPFIAHQLELFKKNKLEEVVMCVGYLHEQIQGFVGDGSQFGLKVVYSIEDEKLDTGGAIKHAHHLLGDQFFVIYGDSYLTCDYQKVATFRRQENRLGLMTTFHNRNEIEPSRIITEGDFVKKYQKDPPPKGADYAEYGLNILPKSIISQVPGAVFPISRYFDILAESQELLAYDIGERFYEIGSHEGLATLSNKLSETHRARQKND